VDHFRPDLEINAHVRGALAEKYGEAPLWPSSVADHGHSYQWSLWAVTETEAHLFTLLANKVFLPKEQRSDKRWPPRPRRSRGR